MASQVNTYKLVLVGDGGVGKTTWMKKIRSGDFEKKYVATLGVEVHPVRFETTDGQHFCFNVWDTAGQEKLGGLRDGYYIGGDCAIAVHDLTSDTTFANVDNWLNDVKRVCNRDGKVIPIVCVGNKRDCKTSTRKHALEISTKEDNKTELLQPFLALARFLSGNLSLELKETPSYKAFFP